MRLTYVPKDMLTSGRGRVLTITIANIYSSNIGAPQYLRKTLTDIKGEINSNTIIVGDFKSPLIPMDFGEGNGSSLQYSCLENPRDGGAWWAAVYGVPQSRTRLKRQQQQQGTKHCP